MFIKKKLKKRYLITVASIFLAVFSVLFLRFFNIDFKKQKELTEKEIAAVLSFDKTFLEDIYVDSAEIKAKKLRDKFESKISYKQLFDDERDFRNFKNSSGDRIYGLKLLNNTHIGFYYDEKNCNNVLDANDSCMRILLDVNGYTKPNKLEKDQYMFKIYKNGEMKQFES